MVERSPASPEADEELSRSYWDESADAWNLFVEKGLDYYREELHGPALLEACGEVSGLEALDLGCGQGWFSRQVASRRAKVTGIDWSERLIAHARRHEEHARLGVAYHVLDAAHVDRFFPSDSFALVTACMSVMDMPRPGSVLAAVRPLLRRNGRVLMSVPHPVTDSSYREWERDAHGNKLSLKIDRYFEAASQVMDWDMKRLPQRFRSIQYRHTLEGWSRMIKDAGLFIDQLLEPRPTSEALARCPMLADAARVPYFLIFDLRAR